MVTKRKQTDTQREALISDVRERVAENVAKRVLGIETLAAQHSDRLDFHTVGVWQIADALREAWECGRAYQIEQDGR